MPLSFSIKQCQVDLEAKYPDVKNEFGESEWSPVFFHMSLTSSLIGMGEITESNWEEWYARVYIWEKVFGTMLIVDGQRTFTSVSMVRDFIGFSVNVQTITATRFRNNLINNLEREAREEARRNVVSELLSVDEQ